MTTIAPAIVTLQSVLATRSDYYELLMWSDHPTIFAALRSRIQNRTSNTTSPHVSMD